MTYKHLDRHDRNQIEILLDKGYLQKDIARVLGMSPSTVSREIKRYSCEEGKYIASIAQHRADIKRRNSKFCGMKIEKDDNLKQRIIDALKNKQSPGGIAARFGDISHVSIYKWLYSAFGQKHCRYLCSRQYKPKRRATVSTKRQMIPDAVPIHERPSTGIHLEGDLFVSSHNTVSVAVLVEPKSQYVWAVKIPNRKPSVMRDAINSVISTLNIDTITWDRGIENRYHAQLSVPSYFCDPHSPWQKPHVENNIGLVRRWFVPKKTDLSCMTQKQLDRYVSIVNDKWRVSRGGKSAHELIEESGILRSTKLQFTI